MESPFVKHEGSQFSSPLEELRFLREEVAKREQELLQEGTLINREQIVREATEQYKHIASEAILHPEYQVPISEQEAIALRLAPEAHDSVIEELYGILAEKGLKNTLDVISKMGQPHIEDDFHRFLVQLLFEQGSVPGLRERDPEFKSLNMVLFEVTFPVLGQEQEKSFKEFLGAMEQFYAGMQAIGGPVGNPLHNYFTIELAQPAGTTDIVVYVCVPRDKALLFEKQILGFYHYAKLQEVTNDYNVFDHTGVSAGAYGYLKENEVYPIRVYGDTLDHDPMSSLINAFSKLREEDGASVQFVITPIGDTVLYRMNKVLEQLEKGKKAKQAVGYSEGWKKDITSISKSWFGPIKEEPEQAEEKVDIRVVELVKEKMSKSLLAVSIRVIASSRTEREAKSILQDLEASFHQFSRPNSNELSFNHILPQGMADFVHTFSYRLPTPDKDMVFNLGEIASLFHFPVASVKSPDLKEAKAGSGPAPQGMHSRGIAIGENTYRGVKTKIYIDELDRMRHFYVIGQTGTGKTGSLLTMIAQDIARGDGVCYIDPHGSDIQTILSMIPPERIDDVIYFDPAYTARPMGLNMLEYDVRYPEQKTFVINELMAIFNQLFDMKTAGGPMFEQYFKNSAGLVMEHPESGNTLLEIGRVLSDKAFRDMKLSHCTNPIIKQFWLNAEKTTGEQGLENFVPYITSKFDTFISNEIMRPVVAQDRSSFNFRDIMDSKKILLVNLSKGRLGEINSNLIGLLIVGKIQMAALSRVDMFGKEFPPFYLYIDEFQNVTTPSIASILSEARKYKLSLNIAHQYLAQISDDIRSAILGNVGSMAVFRISPDDAEKLESRFKPHFGKDDIIKLDNRNAYVSMLIDGQPARPFNMRTLDLIPGNQSLIDQIKDISYLKFGRPRAEIEAEIMEKFSKI